MFEVGTVVNSTVGLNRDGTIPVRLCTCTVSDLTDVRTVQLVGPCDHSPVAGEKLLVFSVEDSWEMGIQIDDVAAALAVAVGERVFAAFSASGVASPTAKMSLDPVTGIVKFGDGTDYVTAFNRMKTAFDTLKAELNAFVVVFNAHSGHTTGSTPSTAAVPATADMSAAQSATVMTP